MTLLHDRHAEFGRFQSGDRSRFLILAQEQHWPRLNQGKNKHDFDRWCVAMPFS
ncbi:hypothetical protein [Nocardia lijiangensis]|uniref:hypothetical protein n=1 Tax=Nocardia lijiangensis TaxID=299618 RepID=UPI0012DE19AC|nr:hypothetical protein [Nocardia lijiangensis]